jgi:predicted O-methyltransferase YrrM
MKNFDFVSMLLDKRKTRIGVFNDVHTNWGHHEVLPLTLCEENYSMVKWAVYLEEANDEQLDHLARIPSIGILTCEQNISGLYRRGWRHVHEMGEYYELQNFGRVGGMNEKDSQTYRHHKNYHHFKFSEHWFTNSRMATYSLYMRHFIDKPIRMLQIGVFEGQDLVWMLQHILTHPDSRVVAIDPWLKKGINAKENAIHNLRAWKNRIEFIEAKSQDVMDGHLGLFDLIVIDGDHSPEAVEVDATNSLLHAKPGAWILFDDIEHRANSPRIRQRRYQFQSTSRCGVINFLKKHKNDVRFLWRHRYAECYKKR